MPVINAEGEVHKNANPRQCGNKEQVSQGFWGRSGIQKNPCNGIDQNKDVKNSEYEHQFYLVESEIRQSHSSK